MIKAGLKIVLLGPQASGKGLQGKLLSDLFGIERISLGDVFRKEVKEKTIIGKKIEKLIESGVLVSNDITFKIVKKYKITK